MLNAMRAALIAALCLTPLAAAQAATPESAAAATTTSSNEPSPPTSEAAPQQSPDAEQAQAEAQERAFYDSLHRRTGIIMVAGGKVRLTIPENYYFIGPEDSRRVIVDLWRNPPDAADGIEGMIFPNDNNPATGAWGAIVQYSADGYVSDSDASSQNYEQALHQMQQSIQDGNAERQHAGYPAMTLVGWAEPPHYDRATHKIYWGKHLHFGDSSVDTLN